MRHSKIFTVIWPGLPQQHFLYRCNIFSKGSSLGLHYQF